MTKENEKALITFSALPAELSAEIFSEVLAPGESIDIFSLPRVKVPAGGGLTWELPDGGFAKELTGVILLRQPVRAYWSAGLNEGSGPPDCSSPDAIHGFGTPGGLCARCPNAAWGSATAGDGEARRGQACRLITRLFVLLDGQKLPLFLPLPPSSQRNAKRYVVELLTEGVPYWRAVTAITLDRKQNREGITYSEAQFHRVAVLDDKAAESVEAYRAAIVPALRDIPIGVDIT